MRFDEISRDKLDLTFEKLGNYIFHNNKTDHSTCAAILRQHGYVEPQHSMPVFRYLNHDVTDEDRKLGTEGAFHAAIRSDVRMDLSRSPQAFTTSLEKAEDVTHSHQWLGHHVIPRSGAQAPLGDFVPVIYEVVAPQENVLWSTMGLKPFLKQAPDSEGKAHLLKAMDPFEGGYNDDELLIDTTSGCYIADVHLYDNSRFFDDE